MGGIWRAMLDWVLCSGSHQTAVNMLIGLHSHLEAHQKNIHFWAYSGYWQILGTYWLLAGDCYQVWEAALQSSTMWFSHSSKYNMAVCFFEASRECHFPVCWHGVLCNIIPPWEFHHLCHVLLARSMSRLFPHLKGMDYTRMFIHWESSCCCSVTQSVQLFATPWTAACQTSLFSTVSQSFLKLMFIESMMPSKHLILCHPLLFLPSIFPSIRAFSSESVHIRWPKYCNFIFSICPSSEYSELISLGLTGFDLLVVQGILKSFQHHSLTASIFWCSSFFMIQLSHPYMTTGKTTSLSAKWYLCFLIYCLGLS